MKTSAFSSRFLAVVRIPLMDLGTVVPLVVASVAGGRSHSLAQATAHAAVLPTEPAPVLQGKG